MLLRVTGGGVREPLRGGRVDVGPRELEEQLGGR